MRFARGVVSESPRSCCGAAWDCCNILQARRQTPTCWRSSRCALPALQLLSAHLFVCDEAEAAATARVGRRRPDDVSPLPLQVTQRHRLLLSAVTRICSVLMKVKNNTWMQLAVLCPQSHN
jgi:hypothetical protein